MTCEVDIKAYALGEASAAERKTVEGHLAGCGSCRAELEALGVVRAALMTVSDEEPPRRIAFVSDKIFEPKWWQRPFGGMNWAQMLAPAALAAVAAFAVVKTQAPAVAPQISQTEVERRVADAVAERVGVAVKEAIAQSDARNEARTAQLVQATERKLRTEHGRAMNETVAMMEANFEMLQKRQAKYLRASAELGARQ